jgi:cell division protein FtsL
MFEWLRRFIKMQFYVAQREFRVVLVTLIGLMVGAMIFVWNNVRLVKLAYESQPLKQERRELLREKNLLEVERESLRSLDRIQWLAKKKIGLKEPEGDQIVTIFLKK